MVAWLSLRIPYSNEIGIVIRLYACQFEVVNYHDATKIRSGWFHRFLEQALLTRAQINLGIQIQIIRKEVHWFRFRLVSVVLSIDLRSSTASSLCLKCASNRFKSSRVLRGEKWKNETNSMRPPNVSMNFKWNAQKISQVTDQHWTNKLMIYCIKCVK